MNKSHSYIIKLIKKRNKNSFVIAVVKKRGKVVEKLGTFCPKFNMLSLNIFRLIFWTAKNVSLSGHMYNILVKFNLVNNSKINV